MDKNVLYQILRELEDGKITAEGAMQKLTVFPYEDLGYARIDHHRALRDNFPEVIFCQGKTVDQVVNIFLHLAQSGGSVLATRATSEMYEKLRSLVRNVMFDPVACIIYLKRSVGELKGNVAVVCAGTADLPVAEEAALTLEVMGARAERIYDVGVAGLHRLLDSMTSINSAQVIIAVAGMEGALASVLGGLTSKPVIAVPTSVGYGASFNGLAALLAMLNTCATGVGVVNIDNGFGAAALAMAILNTIHG